MKARLFFNSLTRLMSCLCALAPCLSTGFADNSADAVKSLQAAIEKEASQKKPDARDIDRYGGRVDMGSAFLAQLRSAIARGEPSQLDELLNQIPVHLKSPEVREAADKLRTALNAEREAREQASAARIDVAIASASKAVREAIKASDLDESLSSLARAQEPGEGSDSERSRLRMDKIRSTRQFVLRWQDYLSNREAGNTQQAIRDLQNASNEDSTDMIPRSEILSRIAELSRAIQDDPAQKIREILDKTKSLDAISPAIDSLSEFQRKPGMSSNNYNDPIVMMKNELNAILQAYREYQAGLPCQMAVRPNESSPHSLEAFNATLRLRVELLRLTLPRILGVDDALKPAQDETIQEYLDRMMANALEHADASLIGRVGELMDSLSGGQNTRSSRAFLTTLLAARNQEAAGQYVPAVISYQLTLKAGGEHLPSAAIGARLDNIKAAHPDDFEKGMQLFLNNPTPAQPQDYYNSLPAPRTVTVPGSITGKPAPGASPSPAPRQSP